MEVPETTAFARIPAFPVLLSFELFGEPYQCLGSPLKSCEARRVCRAIGYR